MAKKWLDAAEDSNRRELSEFVDWLRQRFVLATWTPGRPDAEPRLEPARVSPTALLAAYYEVDLNACERHVQRVLGSLPDVGPADESED